MADSSSTSHRLPHTPDDHERRHQHTHVERDVDENGNVKEKTVIEDIREPELGKGKKGVDKGKGNRALKEGEEAVTAVTDTAPAVAGPDMSSRSGKASGSKKPPSIVDSAVPAPEAHHPEVIVNVNLAPQPVQPKTSPPAPPSIDPTAVPLPTSGAASPVPSLRSMRLLNPFATSTARAVVPTVSEVEKVDEVEDEVNRPELVTKTVTTTTTNRVPVLALRTGLGFVENDPDWMPPKPAAVKADPVPEPSPGRVVETTTVETISYPFWAEGGSAAKGGLRPIPLGNLSVSFSHVS